MSNNDLIGDSRNVKSKTAKKGRRAAKAQEESTRQSMEGVNNDAVDVDEYNLFQSSRAAEGDGIGASGPKPSRRGGWGADSVDAGKSGGDFDERLRAKTPPANEDDAEADIPVIPMIGDSEQENVASDVAMAPHVVVNRVATYKELDSDLIKHTGFLSLDNEIDLKLLSKALSAEADIREEDVPWEWDHLFTEVSSEMLTEWEKQAQPETQAAVV